MTTRPTISVIVATARQSVGALRCSETEHLFARTFASLAAQTVQDFEVIIADTLSPHRDLAAEIAALSPDPWPFPWQVAGVKSWWSDHNLWALQATFNAGAVASRGHYLFFCGDCCVFPPDTIERSVALLERGLCPHFVCIRRMDGFICDYRHAFPTPLGDYRTIEDLKEEGLYTPETLYGNTPTGDTRLSDPMMVANGCILPQHASWQWFYGYGIIPRVDFFSVNGWSELFDGEKSLGDVELGSRLDQCGRLRFYMERDLVVYEEHHNPIALGATVPTVVRSNYDLVWLHRSLNVTRANTHILSHSDLWRVVRAGIAGLHCWPLRSGYLPPELQILTEHWMDYQPIYRLDDQCAGAYA